MSTTYNRKAQVARQRALRRLADAYSAEFNALHDQERARVGLEPPDPSKWQYAGSTATAPAATRAPRRTSASTARTPATNENSGDGMVDIHPDAAAPQLGA